MTLHHTTGLAAVLVLAASASAAAEPPPNPTSFTVEALGFYQFESDINAGGSMALDEAALRLGVSHALSGDVRLGLDLGYDVFDYDFSPGGNGLGATEPWSDIRVAKVGISGSARVGDRWTLFAAPSMRWATEQGASMNDGAYGGVFAAATYRFSDRLSIGPGVGYFSRIEDDASVFPVLAVNWRLTDTLRLSTGQGLAASRGPGLVLEWQPPNPWSFSLGARYENQRFRLDDRGVAPGGVGQDSSFPIFFAATRNLGRTATLSLIAGAKTGGNLRLEDAQGNKLSEDDYETAPFAGGTLKLRF